MRFATKDHIDHIEHDGEMDWEERRLTGDGSPYLGGCLLRVGMSVPAHPPWALGLLLVRGYRGWLKPPTPEEGVDFKSEAAGMKKGDVPILVKTLRGFQLGG